jgi:ABC-2 type transport system permease protein
MLRSQALSLRLYWEVGRRGCRRYATYRAATFAGVVTNTFFGFLRAYVFVALFASRAAVAGFNLSDSLTYVFLGQGMIMAVYLWSWWDVALTIRSGDVVTDLSRPFDYELYWLSQDLGRAVYHVIFRGIPPFVVGALIFNLRFPHHAWTWPLFVLSMAIAVCVSFASRLMVNLAAFWLLDYRGPGTLAQAAWTLLSGFVVPLAFFPGALGTILALLPFAAYINTPMEIFLEKHLGWNLAGTLLLQVGWALALLLAARLLLKAAMRKVVVHGG